jgi:hypothetical protein
MAIDDRTIRPYAHVAKMTEDDDSLLGIWARWALSIGFDGTVDGKLDLFQRMTPRQRSETSSLPVRAAAQYSWAIPNALALKTISELQPVVEIGSGNGYWVYLLRSRGCDVTAVDSYPNDRTRGQRNVSRHAATTWIDDTIVMSGEQFLREQKGCKHATLLFCWPREGMLESILRHYSGNVIVVIGEYEDGCTDSMSKYSRAREWKHVKTIIIPNWFHNHDDLCVYRRRTPKAT